VIVITRNENSPPRKGTHGKNENLAKTNTICILVARCPSRLRIQRQISNTIINIRSLLTSHESTCGGNPNDIKHTSAAINRPLQQLRIMYCAAEHSILNCGVRYARFIYIHLYSKKLELVSKK
jgi:hypothetical protein